MMKYPRYVLQVYESKQASLQNTAIVHRFVSVLEDLYFVRRRVLVFFLNHMCSKCRQGPITGTPAHRMEIGTPSAMDKHIQMPYSIC